ncbi:TetR/AcrR family transcriptional regulator (plasmid) [Coraliomargarita sp. W4R53]
MPASVIDVTQPGRVGRPKASSRETLAEAACELFFEQGFEATSIADIASRAGVSRSSFFNYFASKSDIVWAGLDERIEVLAKRLEKSPEGDAAASVRSAIEDLAVDFVPDSLALATVNTTAMQLENELGAEAAQRSARIADAVARCFTLSGADRLRADVAGAAWGGAVVAAIAAWARDGAGRTDLLRFVSRAADTAELVTPGEPEPK